MLINLSILLVSLTACPKKSVEITPAVKKVEDCANLFKDTSYSECCKMTLTEVPLNTEFKMCVGKKLKLGSRVMFLYGAYKRPECPDGVQCNIGAMASAYLQFIDSTCTKSGLSLQQDASYKPKIKDTLGLTFSLIEVYNDSELNATPCQQVITLKINKK